MASLELQSAIGSDIPNEQDSAATDEEYRHFLTAFEKRWKSAGCVLRLLLHTSRQIFIEFLTLPMKVLDTGARIV